MMETTSMAEGLVAPELDKSLGAKLELYGQFVGSWQADVTFYFLDGTQENVEGELHFERVLEGTAIQDLFIYPARHLRTGPRQPWWRYGSTFRWYDPDIDAWHITFFDPGRSVENHQIGRAVGNDIVQIGEDQPGVLRRWRFVDITGSSFTWLGELSWDRGSTWTLHLRTLATRRRRSTQLEPPPGL